ncbi:hypothetical protein HN587_03660 [Candidatus Woesearchaeota archaeon]|jgi:hypothetical protein|nr:hypothetical protein [Candidatus Woesearchaeota archaeon]
MDEVRKLFKELYFEIFKIVILNSLLDSLIFFFILHLNLSFFNISFYYALIASLIFFSINILIRMKKAQLKYVEDKNPSIREILRTARDSFGSDNFMIRACFEDLIERMKKASSGNMVSGGTILFKSAIITGLCFFIVVFAPYSVNVDAIVNDFELPAFLGGGNGGKGVSAFDFYGTEFNNSGDIYGDESVALLGDDEIELMINPELNELNLDQVKPIEDKIFQQGNFPGEVVAVNDELSGEKVPEESKIAIAYNLKIMEDDNSK